MSDCSCKECEPGAAEAAKAVKPHCPRCGQPGQHVSARTLKHHVQPEHLTTVDNGSFSFCRTPTCDVVYYNESGLMLSRADVRLRVGVKETVEPVPLCYCFGFTEAMIVEEIRATGSCEVPQRIAAEVKKGNCACEIRNPQGSCCLGSVNAAVKKAMKAG